MTIVTRPEISCFRLSGSSPRTFANAGRSAAVSGHGTLRESDASHIGCKNADVVILPDNDEPGEQHAAMVAKSVRGTGKTHLACGSSFAVATGTKFLKWNAPTPRRVLHCDGEMAAAELRDRFRQIMDGSQVKPGPGILNILTADLLEFGIGNLASVQAEMEPLLDGVELLVLDNLSSLTAVIRDNDAESWNPIQEWLLRLRRRGTSVLIVHHAGKGGEQRGTSRREDVLDTSISLRRPSDFVQEEGARFEIHYEKVRGVYGNKIKPFEARMETRDGAALWTLREIEDVNMARVRALLDQPRSRSDCGD
jgi:putative DNA primase/helicase